MIVDFLSKLCLFSVLVFTLQIMKLDRGFANFVTKSVRFFASATKSTAKLPKKAKAKPASPVSTKTEKRVSRAVPIIDESLDEDERFLAEVEDSGKEGTDGTLENSFLKKNRPSLSTRSEPVIYKLIQSCLVFAPSKPSPGVVEFSKHIEQTVGPFFDTGGACFDFRKETVEKKVEILLKNNATVRQIVEIPDFLLQNVEHIERRIAYLLRRGVTTIYPAMLHHSMMEGNRVRPYERECSTYLDIMSSSHSEIHADYVSKNLATEKNRFSLDCGAFVVSTYFLRTCQSLLALDGKLKYIREKKIDVDQVAINLSNFFMRSLPTIQQRCEMLESAGLPLDLAAVLSPFTAFKHWYELGKTGKEAKDADKSADRFDLFAKMLQTTRDQIIPINYMRSRHLAQLDRLLRLLLANGVKPSEILSHSYVFEYRPVPRLLDAAEYLISKGLTPFTLTQLEKLSIDGRLVRPYATISRVMGLAKALQCPASELTSLIPVETKRAIPNFFTAQKRIKFLESRGFSLKHIRRCPLILLHEEDTVAKHLDELPSKQEMQPYNERWRDDKQKILGAVEYFCERENNFTLPVTPPS